MNNWTLIYTAENTATASIIKGMLEENNITVLVINKQDSSYLNFGTIELYVPQHLQPLASNLLNQSIVN